MDQIAIQGPRVPLLVEVVMSRLEDVMARNAELERALSDLPRSSSADAQRVEALEAQCEQAEQRYEAAQSSMAQFQDRLVKADQERKSALESARVLRGKLQNSAAEVADLRLKLLEERESRKRIIELETGEVKEQALKERKQLEEAQRALADARAKLAPMKTQAPSPDGAAWDSVQRHIALAVEHFEEDPDKSLHALKRARLALETRQDDD